MTTCQECRNFYPLEDNQDWGDCVQRVKDPRQAYFQSKPVSADEDASSCASFHKKQEQ